MEIFKQLNKKGYKHYYEGTVEELDSMDKDNQHLHSEIMQVIMWLYEKHVIWIECYIDDNKTFGYLITKITKEGRIDSPLNREYNAPTEVFEAAIEYTLKNLI